MQLDTVWTVPCKTTKLYGCCVRFPFPHFIWNLFAFVPIRFNIEMYTWASMCCSQNNKSLNTAHLSLPSAISEDAYTFDPPFLLHSTHLLAHCRGNKTVVYTFSCSVKSGLSQGLIVYSRRPIFRTWREPQNSPKNRKVWKNGLAVKIHSFIHSFVQTLFKTFYNCLRRCSKKREKCLTRLPHPHSNYGSASCHSKFNIMVIALV